MLMGAGAGTAPTQSGAAPSSALTGYHQSSDGLNEKTAYQASHKKTKSKQKKRKNRNKDKSVNQQQRSSLRSSKRVGGMSAAGTGKKQTRQQKDRKASDTGNGVRIAKTAASVLTACILSLFLWIAWGTAQVESQSQAVASVRDAVVSAAKQCAAVEGAYPPDLEYLQEHYGLIINEADYDVAYEAFASNVPPTVTVVPK